MTPKRKPLNFGPSERYLPGLTVGEALTFKFLDIGVDVDTDYGQKLQFHIEAINFLGSPSSSLHKGGEFTWNTVCKSAHRMHEYFIDNDMDSCDWTFILIAEEFGYRIKEPEVA